MQPLSLLGRRKKWLLLVVVLVVVFGLLWALSPYWHPCQRRLRVVARTLTEIWQDPQLVAQVTSPENYEWLLRNRIKVPLTCPRHPQNPYQLFPAPHIAVADLHPDGKGFAVQVLYRRGEMVLRVIPWSPPPEKAMAATNFLLDLVAALLEPLLRVFSRVLPPRSLPDCSMNLRNVGLALLQYVQDYDDRFPPMDNPDILPAMLYPYVRNLQVFLCPTTNHAYQPNPHLSYKSLAQIYAPSQTPAVHDSILHPDGYRNTGFVDGHVKLVSPQEWQRLQPYYRFPEKPHP